MSADEPISRDVAPFATDFRDLLETLKDHHVDFVLIGGWAVALYGFARTTEDLDVLVRASSENSRRLVRALSEFGAPVAQHGVRENYFAEPGPAYRMGRKPVLVEILTRISGVDFDACVDDAELHVLGDTEVRVIGLDALIANKVASGRPKDLIDAEELRRIRAGRA
jgi:predicted nucleotidyltransferase